MTDSPQVVQIPIGFEDETTADSDSDFSTTSDDSQLSPHTHSGSNFSQPERKGVFD